MPKTPVDAEPKTIERLTRRRQFLNTAKGKRYHASAFTLQSAASDPGEPRHGSRQRCLEGIEPPHKNVVGVAAPGQESGHGPRFGITVTKKIGGAVMRNRIRRRFKEALRCLVPLPARPGRDYVIVARLEALAMPFPLLKESLAKALARIDGARSKTGGVRSNSDTLPRWPEGDLTAPDSNARPPRKDTINEAPKA